MKGVKGIGAHGIVVFVSVPSKFELAQEGYEIERYLGAVLEYNLEKLVFNKQIRRSGYEPVLSLDTSVFPERLI